QPIQPLPLLRSGELRLRLFCQRQEPAAMPPPRPLRLSRFQQPIPRILPHRLQQPIPPLALPLFIEDERLLYQAPEQVQHPPLYPPARRFCRLQSPPSREDGEATQQGLRRSRQEIVAPIDECSQRLLPGQRRATAAREETKHIVESLVQLLYREGLHPCRRQL